MDQYLATKRRCMSITALLKIVSVHQALKMVLQAIDEEKRNRTRKLQSAKISLMLNVKMVRKIKRQGGIRKLNHNRMRYAFMFGGSMLHHRMVEYDIKKVMEQFLIKKMFINELLQKGKNF